MKMRNKIISMCAVAAALAIAAAVAAFAAGGFSRAPRPDVLAQPAATDAPKQREEILDFIYYSEEGECFHRYETCGGETYPLKTDAVNAFFSVTAPSPNKPCCPVCLPYGITVRDGGSDAVINIAPSPDPLVYYTEGGEYYHMDEHCSGMEDAICGPFSDAVRLNKTPCPLCCDPTAGQSGTEVPILVAEENSEATGPVPEEGSQIETAEPALLPGDAMVYTEAGGRYYHIDEHCSGMQDAELISMTGALALGRGACTVCIPEDSPLRDFSKNPLFTGATEEADQTPDPVLYCTPNGKYYHYFINCSGMEGAQAVTPDQAIINTGKHACPVCFDTEEKKAAYMLPPPEADTDSVYIAVDNNYYHIDPDCFSMVMVSKADLKTAREMGKSACPACLITQADTTGMESCWATHNGKYFHSDPNCSGMEGASLGLVVQAQAMGKLRCPLCMQTLPEDHDLFVTAFGRDINQLYPGYAYDHSNEFGGFSEWIISNGEESITLCEVHPKGTAFFGEELPGVPELQLTGLSLDAQQVHDFLSAAPAPIGSMYAAAPAEVDKRSAGRSAEELQLQAVTVYFDENRRVRACEMQFGFYDHVLLKWQVNADGGIELIEAKFVKP